MIDTKTPQLHLDIIIEKQDSEFVAHCLQMDIVSSAITEEIAVQEMVDLISAQVEFAIKHDNLEYLFKPAPAETWQKLARIFNSKNPRCKPMTDSKENMSWESYFCYA